MAKAEETPKNITPIKRRGIDMVVKSLNKPYPFIIGYQDDTSEQYASSHYIDLIIDLNKLSSYLKAPINPYWRKVVDNDPQNSKTYSLWVYLNFPKEYEIEDNPGYILSQDILDTIDLFYSSIPDEYKLFYEYSSEYFTGDLSREFPVRLLVNAYLFK